MTPYMIRGVSGDKSLETLHLQVAKSEETTDLNVDYLIVNYGFTTNLNLKDWQINSSRQGIPVQSDMKSSKDGVYCCGDITQYDGKVDLIATGFGEAPTAVNNALHYIDPKIEHNLCIHLVSFSKNFRRRFIYGIRNKNIRRKST
ncbi:hypothetical protein GCM10025857_66230 [Alicyclobacillus contaminans]|nr:hypothetical protein GCM10025857_66230 [Alicyclobacillus contaminans]